MKPVHWLVTAPLTLLLIDFAVSNLERVPVGIWPFSDVALAPLWLVVLAALLVGFLFGELVAWVNGRRWRREARRRARRIEALERELAATQAKLPPAERPAGRLPASEMARN